MATPPRLVFPLSEPLFAPGASIHRRSRAWRCRTDATPAMPFARLHAAGSGKSFPQRRLFNPNLAPLSPTTNRTITLCGYSAGQLKLPPYSTSWAHSKETPTRSQHSAPHHGQWTGL